MASLPILETSRSEDKPHRRSGEPEPVRSTAVERLGGSWARRVPLDDIDRSDTRFQYRLSVSHSDLVDSLRAQGQLNPVILWGERPAYIVVDGFRRIDAVSALGGTSVRAVFAHAMDEAEVFAISFAENVRRRSLTPQDKANAIWRAVHVWQMDKREVATALALSVRQVERYLSLLDLSAPLLEAVTEGRISMSHAILLDRASLRDPSEWIDAIAERGLSAEELKRRLRRTSRGRPTRSYLVRDSKGFRLRGVRYRSDMSPAEKRRIWEALEGALKLIAASS